MHYASCQDLTDARAGVEREQAGRREDQTLVYFTVLCEMTLPSSLFQVLGKTHLQSVYGFYTEQC